MRVEFINPFLEAADHVFNQLFGIQFQRGRLSLKMPEHPYPNVCIVLGVVGNVEGQVIYGANRQVATEIASKMLMGAQLDSLNEMAQSALGELGNMITGQATMSLEKSGYNVDISPPTIIIGNEVKISSHKTQILVVPLYSDEIKQFDIHVGLEAKK